MAQDSTATIRRSYRWSHTTDGTLFPDDFERIDSILGGRTFATRWRVEGWNDIESGVLDSPTWTEAMRRRGEVYPVRAFCGSVPAKRASRLPWSLRRRTTAPVRHGAGRSLLTLPIGICLKRSNVNWPNFGLEPTRSAHSAGFVTTWPARSQSFSAWSSVLV